MKKFLQQLFEFIEKYRKQITYVLFLFSALLVFAIYNLLTPLLSLIWLKMKDI